MIEAIILGSGTSNGVPSLGHHYPASFLANPKNHRMRASLMLCGPTGNFLVDCSPEMRLQVTREEIFDIEAVLITHTHADHVMGMDDLRSISMRNGTGLPIYAQPKDQVAIRRIFDYAFREFPPGVMVPRFDLRDVPESISVGGMTIQTFLVKHGSTTVVGLRVNDFAYVTDVSEIPPEAAPYLQNLDVLVLDAVRYKPHPNHFHFDKALETIHDLAPKQAFLTHLSHDYDHDHVEAALPQNIGLAYDRQRFRIQ
ncbi:MBL fold metallo-hydrolase [soil metagenome]